MSKVNYQKHYQQFKKYAGSLRKYCDSRRPKLNYESTKKTFQRLKKGEESGNKKPKKNSPKIPRKVVKDTKGNSPKRQLSKRVIRYPPQKLNHPQITEPDICKTISVKHQKVVDNYLKCLHKVQAYMRVFKKCKHSSAVVRVKVLFRRAEVKAYLAYQRELTRARTQIDLRSLVEAHKEVAFYDLDQDVKIDLSGLDKYGQGDMTDEETKKFLRNTRVRYVTVKNEDGSETLEQVIEYDIGLKYTANDIQKARNDLYKLLIAENHDVSAQSTHEEVREAWELFIKKEINAIDFCYILEKLKCKVPEVIKIQAEAEIKSLKDEGMLILKEAIPMIDGKNFSVDDQLKIVIERAAKDGNVGDMMSALKTLAAMKIVKASFNFSIFSKFARMGFDGEVVDSGDENLIKIEAQKWEE